jgi:hypothetical protein
MPQVANDHASRLINKNARGESTNVSGRCRAGVGVTPRRAIFHVSMEQLNDFRSNLPRRVRCWRVLDDGCLRRRE